jgi:hypothetical protein
MSRRKARKDETLLELTVSLCVSDRVEHQDMEERTTQPKSYPRAPYNLCKLQLRLGHPSFRVCIV